MSEAEVRTQQFQFKADLSGDIRTLWKSDDRMVVWGPASVEVVDKENDLVEAEALKDALPQLMKRKRLSYEHADQIVGDIKESFETDEPTTVEFNGRTITRKEFPTGVLELDGMEPALFVCGEIYNDSRLCKEVREGIREGRIDSYSISGDAVQTKTKVERGQSYDRITKLDLSAVTLCKDGMNPKAKFGTVQKEDSGIETYELGKSHDMSNEDSGGEDSEKDLTKQFKEAASEVMEETDFATKEDVEQIVEQKMEEEDEEDSPEESTEGMEGEEVDEEEKADDEEPEEDPEGGDLDSVDADEIEDPDGDGEAEVDIEEDSSEGEEPRDGMDEEMSPNPDDGEPGNGGDDEEVEEKAGYTEDEMKEKMPSDLFEASMEYLDGEAEPDEEGGMEEEPGGPEEMDMEEEEKSDDSESVEKSEPVDREEFGDDYASQTVGMTITGQNGIPTGEEVEKSEFSEVEKGDTEEGSADSFEKSAARQLIYKDEPIDL